MKDFTWQHIEFVNGGNPYICKTKKEFKRIQSKYSLEKIKESFWKATDRDIIAKDSQIEHIWEEFEDVLFVEGKDLYEEDNEKYKDWKDSSTLVLASDWRDFEAGTSVEEIWYWFDENHSKGVGWLMNEYEPEE